MRSGSGSWRPAVLGVPVNDPKNGMVLEAAQSLDGSMDTKCSASVSPGSAPSTSNGPVCGFTNGNWITFETRSSGPRTFPPKASSVQSSSTVPGLTLRTGLTPPNVQANSEGSGRYVRTSTDGLRLPSEGGEGGRGRGRGDLLG